MPCPRTQQASLPACSPHYPFFMLSAKQGSCEYHFLKSLGMTRLRNEPQVYRQRCGRSNHYTIAPVAVKLIAMLAYIQSKIIRAAVGSSHYAQIVTVQSVFSSEIPSKHLELLEILENLNYELKINCALLLNLANFGRNKLKHAKEKNLAHLISTALESVT